MSRTAIAATIVTNILALPSPSLAASEEEVFKLRDKTAAAFKCAIYANNFDDQKEEQRLFQIGLKAGRDAVEGAKSLKDSPMSELQTYMPGVTTDFLVGQMWEEQSNQVGDEIRNSLVPKRWEDLDARKYEAERRYRESNCSLIQ